MKLFFAKVWKKLHLPKGLQLWLMGLIQDKFLVGVTGIFFTTDNRVLLFKHSYRQGNWSLPGGYMKAREHPTEGLEREIEEESGFVVAADAELEIRTDRETARIDLCYVGTFIGGRFRPSSEVTEFGLFMFEDLPMIPSNHLILIQMALKQRELCHRVLAT